MRRSLYMYIIQEWGALFFPEPFWKLSFNDRRL
jgi:hypothetical protein